MKNLAAAADASAIALDSSAVARGQEVAPLRLKRYAAGAFSSDAFVDLANCRLGLPAADADIAAGRARACADQFAVNVEQLGVDAIARSISRLTRC
jgi:hypothetical protein